MILRTLAVTAFVTSVCLAPAFAEARFFSTIDDLPLAPGLTESAGGFAFDSAEGRIVAVEAAGAATPAAVRGFYVETLPALGWSLSPSPAETLEFVRGRERLTLAISGAGTHAQLEARLVTRPAAMGVD